MPTKYTIEDAPAQTPQYTIEDAPPTNNAPAPRSNWFQFQDEADAALQKFSGRETAEDIRQRHKARYGRDVDAGPINNAMNEADATLSNVARRGIAGVAGMFVHPLDSAKELYETGKELVTAPLPIPGEEQAAQDWVNKDNGPINRQINDFQETYKRSPREAIENLSGDMLAMYMSGKLLDAAGKPIKAAYREKFPATKVGKDSYLASALSRTPTSNKNFIVQDISKELAEPMRQAAANNPDIAAVVAGNDPVQAYAAQMALFEKASQWQDDMGQAIGEQVADVPVDPNMLHEATKALRPTETAKGLFPEDADWLENFRGRLNKMQKLGDLDNARKELNERATSLYKSATDDAGTVRAKAYKQAADSIRNLYYDRVEHFTKKDLRSIKKTQGSILNAMDAFSENKAKLTREHHLFKEPKSATQKLADIAGGSMDPTSVGKRAVTGYLKEKLGGSQLQQIHGHLKSFYSDLPPATKPGVVQNPGTPAPRLGLPVPSRPMLPESTGLPNADAYGPTDAGGYPQGLAVYHVDPDGNIHQGPPPARGPVLTPEPPMQTRALPAQAGPNGSGVPPPAPRTYPPTYEPAARTQVSRTLAERARNPRLPLPSGDGITATPEGFSPNRKSLPAPKSARQLYPSVGEIRTIGGKKMKVVAVNPKTGELRLQEVQPAPRAKNATDAWADGH